MKNVSAFTPVIKLSTDVMGDLLLAANDRRMTVDEVDFDLLSYETYFQKNEGSEWQALEEQNLLECVTEAEIRSSTFSLRQEYQIQIREYRPHPHLDLRMSIAADKYKTKMVAIIDPRSIIPLKKGVQEWIKEAIVRKQLRHALLIGIYDRDLNREINRLLLKIQKEGPLTAPYRLSIGEFFPPVPPTDDAIILHYKKNKKDRSLIEGVHPGDLILEYIFPKQGRDGRGCDGNHIGVAEPQIKYASYIVIDEKTISREEDADSIRFYAKVSGYVEREKGVFTISQELQIDSASFRKTGSIEAGKDKEISLKIKQNISSEDSVGTGVKIDIQKLDVSGTVGSHAKIQACELTIGAQTHKKSDINVTENAMIHLHRGNLKAKEANINILEAGKVEADVVHVSSMMGGEIVAREVYVDILYSNARITALESITINRIEGEGNDLIIDPHSITAYHDKISALELEIQAKTAHLDEEGKAFVDRQRSFKENNSRIKQFQQRILNAQKSGTAPMKADLVRVSQYKAEAEKLKNIREELHEAQTRIHALHKELDQYYEADLHGVITHHGIYNGHNRVLFIDPKTHQEYAITPEGKVPKIRLDREGDEKKILLES